MLAFLSFSGASDSQLVLDASETKGTITAPILADAVPESTESFTVTLGQSTNAQLGDGAGLGQILDASSIIDLTLPGRYFADATVGPGADDFIIIANPNSVSLPVVLTFVKPSGAWVRRTFTLGAKNRTALHLAGEPGVGGQGEA